MAEASNKEGDSKVTMSIKIGAGISGLVFLVLVVPAVLAMAYNDKILPSLEIGNLQVGGQSEAEVRSELSQAITKLESEGITVHYQNGEGEETLVVPVNNVADLDLAVATVVNFGKEGNLIKRGWRVLSSWTGQAEMDLPGIKVKPEQITELVKNTLAPLEHPAEEANLKVISANPFKYEVTTSTPGVIFEYTSVGDQVLQAWKNLKVPQVVVASVVDDPEISQAEVNAYLAEKGPGTALVFANPILLTHYDAHTKRPYQWSISKTQLAEWVQLKRNEQGLYLAIRTEAVADFVSGTIKKVVDKEPSDATFILNAAGTKATKFIGARPGVTVDLKATEEGIEKIFETRTFGQTAATSTPLVVTTVAPKLKTEDTNDLGIKEILGYGTSYFSGSPRNRILNIKNAVLNKLNGTIVKPGEEFSLVNTLKPFTLEAGYLPELVILGNRITPEIAGGLCQVGTTMFRAAMNSGLTITARTNHGLVISYYNDLSNGKPGTDATIYEPNPDFRFRNDTGHHVLISTDMNVNTGELTFYVWGTNDGRKAYFTPPQVLQWIPAGSAQTIETSDLIPGKKECQGAHPGAMTTFNYVRVLANGTKEVREFKSTYRAVPATCYVGRDPNAIPAEPVPGDPATPVQPGESTPVPFFDPASDLVPAN